MMNDTFLFQRAALTLFALISPSSPAVAADSSEKSVLQAEDRYATAVSNRDRATLLSMLCDDLAYVHASGQRVDRDAYLADTLMPGSRLRSMRFMDRRVRSAQSIASVTGRVIYDMGVDREARYSATYLRKDGHWCLTSWQNTGVRPPPS